MMKKNVLLVMIALLGMGQSAFAYNFSAVAPSGQTLYYNILGSGSVEVTTSYSSSTPTGSLVIPNSVTYGGNTYSVTSIGNDAFYGCSGLTSVTIPNSVTTIGEFAFRDCSGLTSVTIPNSVTSIGTVAFSGCSGLTSVTIPNSVTSIGNAAFAYCSGLTSVTIGNSVTSIGNDAFYGCSGLTSVTIPNSVTSIGNSAFYGCSGLISLTIPNSVTSIGDYAFSGCSGLTSIDVESGNTHYDSRDNCNAIIQTDMNHLVQGCKTTAIPSTVTAIALGAFEGCSSLTSVIIPNSVTSIGERAFYGCSGLTSVTIGNSLTSIGDNAFSQCTGLMQITTLASIAPSLGASVFYTVSNTIPVNIPCGSMTSYQSSWNYFSNFIEPPAPYSISVGTGDPSMGYSNITEGPTCDSMAAIIAMANYGYHFTHWSDGNTSNPRAITLTQDTSFTAYFERNSYAVTVLSNNNAMGQATGGDTVLYLDSVTISATSYYGYHFAHWQDGNTDNPRTVLVTQNKAYTAYFDFDQFTLTVQSDNTAQGNVSGGGSYNYLSNRTITATPNYGHHFTYWNDGVTENPRTITLTQDTSFTAYFALNQYTLTVNAGEHGTATGSGTYNFGDTITIQAFPEEHYHFTRWNDGNTENPRQYRIEDNITLTAFFVIDTYTVSVVSSDIIRGMVEANGTEFAYGTPCTVTATAYTGYSFAGWSNGVTANPYTFAVISNVELTALFVEEGEEVYTVTVESADPTMGTVSGGGQALSGGTLTIRAIPNDGYRFRCWNDGNTENPRTVTVTGNITYTAYFESTQGIGDVDATEIKIYTTGGRIVVQGAEGMEKRVYDLMGREVVRFNQNGETPVLPSGVYLVKVGTLPTRKVVVMR